MARTFLWGEVHQAIWPVLGPLTGLYRRTVRRNLRTVAITGSFGKTTTTRAVAAVLDCEIAKGSNHRTGLALRILRTPMRQRWGLFETGISGPGQMRRMAAMLRPDIAVLTGIGSEHSRSLGSLEVTRDEKGELIRALAPQGVAMLNADDDLAMTVADWSPGRRVTFGFSPNADVRVIDCNLARVNGNVVRALVHGREIEVETRLLGRHMVYPVLVALAVAHEESVDLEVAAKRLASFHPHRGRMASMELPNGAFLIDDSYKGSFESYLAAIRTVAELPAQRRLLVLGDITEPPGKLSDAYRALGREIAEVEDCVLFHVGRESQPIRAGAKRAGFSRESIHCLGEAVLPAAETICGEVRPGDVVLLKGRDTQKFERIRVLLQGGVVRCGLKYCDKRGFGCDACDMLERGWDGVSAEFMDTRKLGVKPPTAA